MRHIVAGVKRLNKPSGRFTQELIQRCWKYLLYKKGFTASWSWKTQTIKAALIFQASIP